ncbi:MAG: DUF2141 domain-containing protein [Rikenellaceae bacterium]|jgi:uncharacterized protein (DUF2141 family)|nr:DUF2141 domain-containing protein [Rikenellaceae bacterium]
MKKLFLTVACAAAALILAAQNKLTLTVDGVTENKGNLMVALFDETGWPKFTPVAGEIASVKGTSVTVTIDLSGVPAGDYAIALFQDENGNRRLDMGLTGLPLEPYGFSNDAKPVAGPPAFHACKFILDGDTALHITVRKAEQLPVAQAK